MVFTGTYKRSLDGKLRVLLPKRLRSGLPRLGVEEGDNLFLTPGTDHCLELHTAQSLNELAIRANLSSAGSKSVRSFSRLFYARAQQCDIDKQGRIRIPQELANLADLSKEIVFIGVGFHWELWDLDLWQSYLDRYQDAFDQVADKTFDCLPGSAENDSIVNSPLAGDLRQASEEEADSNPLMQIPSMSVQQKSRPR